MERASELLGIKNEDLIEFLTKNNENNFEIGKLHLCHLNRNLLIYYLYSAVLSFICTTINSLFVINTTPIPTSPRSRSSPRSSSPRLLSNTFFSSFSVSSSSPLLSISLFDVPAISSSYSQFNNNNSNNNNNINVETVKDNNMNSKEEASSNDDFNHYFFHYFNEKLNKYFNHSKNNFSFIDENSPLFPYFSYSDININNNNNNNNNNNTTNNSGNDPPQETRKKKPKKDKKLPENTNNEQNNNIINEKDKDKELKNSPTPRRNKNKIPHSNSKTSNNYNNNTEQIKISKKSVKLRGFNNKTAVKYSTEFWKQQLFFDIHAQKLIQSSLSLTHFANIQPMKNPINLNININRNIPINDNNLNNSNYLQICHIINDLLSANSTCIFTLTKKRKKDIYDQLNQYGVIDFYTMIKSTYSEYLLINEFVHQFGVLGKNNTLEISRRGCTKVIQSITDPFSPQPIVDYSLGVISIFIHEKLVRFYTLNYYF